jgi:putative thioredoxin
MEDDPEDMMSNYGNIIIVTEADFEYQVVAYSQQVPVVVDFWAEWCGPCKMLGPLLERLAAEGEGSFRLAKVDVDENPNLSRRFNIRSIPTVKGFVNGQPVAEFVGMVPESQVREFLKKLIPDESTLELEKGMSLLGLGQMKTAEETFRKLLEAGSDSPLVPLGLAKSLLLQGRGSEALQLIDAIPVGKAFGPAETLRPLALALASEGEISDDLLEIAYQRAITLVKRGNLPAALDGLLDILRESKRFRGGEAQKVILAIFELLGNQDPLTLQYRRELSSVLF